MTKCGKKFRVKINLGKLNKHIGVYPTKEEAFQAYKEVKEAYIKEIADKWKDRINGKVYQTLMKYEVNIND